MSPRRTVHAVLAVQLYQFCRTVTNIYFGEKL